MASKVYEMRKVRPIRVEGEAAYVTLTKGFEAIIDVADLPLVSGRNWTAKGAGRCWYAYRNSGVGGRQRNIFMHRMIIGANPEDHVDHIDGNSLNNRRDNLRLCTQQQNMWNRATPQMGQATPKGVRKNEGWGYSAAITKDGQAYHLGKFATPEEASAAYYGAARVLFGDFARRA